MNIAKSKTFFILVSLIFGVFLTPSVLSYNQAQGTIISTGDDSIDSSNTDNTNSVDNSNSGSSTSGGANSMMKSSGKSSYSHVQAKKYPTICLQLRHGAEGCNYYAG